MEWRRTFRFSERPVPLGFSGRGAIAMIAVPANYSESGMIVNALMAHGANFERAYLWIIFQKRGDVANHIFDKSWIVIRLHCYESFVCALEKRINRRGG